MEVELDCGGMMLVLDPPEHIASALALAHHTLAARPHEATGTEQGPVEPDPRKYISRQLAGTRSYERAVIRDLKSEHVKALCQALGEFAAGAYEVTEQVGAGAVHPIYASYGSYGPVAVELAGAIARAWDFPHPEATGDA